MDSLIIAAARALAAGDPLGALQRVALREDAHALALRGVAMAQLGDFVRAKALIRGAARAFGPKQTLARARCVVAEAEIALATRDLRWPAKALDAARATLEEHGDRLNAAHARYLSIRRLVLLGRLAAAEQALSTLDAAQAPPALSAVHELLAAGVAMRRLQAQAARSALERAAHSARLAQIPALMAEVDHAWRVLHAPAARVLTRGTDRLVNLNEVERLYASNALVIDACRYSVHQGRKTIALASRPVLFALTQTLAEAWPQAATRQTLISRAFRSRRVDDSYRARLRVEIGRLRRALHSIAEVSSTGSGFVLTPRRSDGVVVIAPPAETPHANVLALLADGESWSSSALALALGASQRTVQRALEDLTRTGVVQTVGRGRARRFVSAPPAGFATTLLLPAALATD